MLKRIVCALAAAIMLFVAGCTEKTAGDNGIKVVCGSFAEYDWVKNIVGDCDAEVTLLTDNGTDMHSYQPTAADIVAIGNADLVVYTGGTADGWMTDVLKNSGNEKAGLRLMDVLNDRLLPPPTAIEEDHDDHDVYDEHIWLSLKNARAACNEITGRLCAADGKNEDNYRASLKQYDRKLKELDEDFTEAVGDGEHTLVFADRFPFVYLLSDYGIGYCAAFPGCSAETDADFETVVRLADELERFSLGCVITIEGSDGRLAKTVIENTGEKDIRILTLDSMQSVTEKDIGSGKDYISVMKGNLSVLKEAIG